MLSTRFVVSLALTQLIIASATAFVPGAIKIISKHANSELVTKHRRQIPAMMTVLPDFESQEDYMAYLKKEEISKLPKGFATGTGKGTFVSEEAPLLGNLPIKGTIIYLTEGPTDNWAAVFTKNKFPGAPIIVGKKRLSSGKPIQALVINNKVSNVCAGGDGVGNAELVCKAVADGLKLKGGAESVLPSSTGVIGWKLPAKELAEQVVPIAIGNLQTADALNAAEAIMTTDRFPKIRSATLKNSQGEEIRIVGIAKGAGMIEPNMATMLSYLMTDATIPKDILQGILSRSVDQSYNSISVDGDESTSDTVVLVASNQVEEETKDKEKFYKQFEDALLDITQGLASDIVRNGEGTGHVMRVAITNFPGTNLDARKLGRHIVNSPLFKCAVSGNDPNTGRLAAAIGSFMGKFGDGTIDIKDSTTLTLGGRVIFTKGKFVLDGGDAVEKELSSHMETAEFDKKMHYPPHQKYVEIGVDFGDGTGTGTATVLGSDLTDEYVAVNADYRS